MKKIVIVLCGIVLSEEAWAAKIKKGDWELGGGMDVSRQATTSLFSGRGKQDFYRLNLGAQKFLKDNWSVSEKLESDLRDLNLSALEGFLVAKEDLLFIHELKLSHPLKRFFLTTNAIESLNSLIEEDMCRVKRWLGSEHSQRWFSTHCLAAEKRMRKISEHALH